MALSIHQKPLYDLLPSGEKIIFTVKNLQAVTTYKKVKYIARVYVAKLTSDLGTSSNLGASSLVATLKTNPNSAGVGIFDLSPILDNYVSPDFEGGDGKSDGTPDESEYKQSPFSNERHSIHTIDKYCANQNACKYFRVVFNMEYAGAAGGGTTIQDPVGETSAYVTSEEHLIFNGFLDDNDILKESGGDYGYHLSWNDWIMAGTSDQFLTNAPKKQYIREDDYATLAFFNNLKSSGSYQTIPKSFEIGSGSATWGSVKFVKAQFYYNGSTAGSVIQFQITYNGAYHATNTSDSNHKLHYRGVGPANLENGGSSIPANWDYYTIIAYDDDNQVISDTYEFHKQDDSCKGYETIRLTWLNKFGVWDYYNFTQKNIRTYEKESVTYEQQDGTWNGDKFVIDGYKGGQRIYKHKATELITLNSNFITEEECQWLEELFISSEVFILKQNSTDYNNQGIIRKYLEPVVMSSGEFIRKTTANDGKKQITIQIQKSKNRKTHRI